MHPLGYYINFSISFYGLQEHADIDSTDVERISPVYIYMQLF